MTSAAGFPVLNASERSHNVGARDSIPHYGAPSLNISASNAHSLPSSAVSSAAASMPAAATSAIADTLSAINTADADDVADEAASHAPSGEQHAADSEDEGRMPAGSDKAECGAHPLDFLSNQISHIIEWDTPTGKEPLKVWCNKDTRPSDRSSTQPVLAKRPTTERVCFWTLYVNNYFGS